LTIPHTATLQTYLVPVLTFFAVLCLGGAAVSVGLSRRRVLEMRLQGQSTHLDPAETADGSLALRMVRSMGALVSRKGPSSDLRRKLVRAGYHGKAAASLFLGTKVLCLLVGMAVLAAVAVVVTIPPNTKLMMVFGGAGMCFFLPNFLLESRAGSRRAEVRRHLPDMVDLLEICVSGGMGLDMAWNAVADEIRGVCPLLADEMALTNLELHLGEDRGNAIRHMADRTGADELSSLVAVLVQSQRFGTSVSDALRVFADSMRQLRSERAEESAEKMSVQMLFPMITFIFPVVLIVAVGPAAIKLVDALGAK